MFLVSDCLVWMTRSGHPGIDRSIVVPFGNPRDATTNNHNKHGHTQLPATASTLVMCL